MRIYLARHGQTTGDVEDRFGGDYEDHMTDLGKRQANALAEKLSNNNIERIYASPRIRARETAEILKQKLNVVVEIVENFRERNHYGVMTGMVKSEAIRKYPDLIALLSDTKNTIRGGEDYESFKKRIEEAWKSTITSNYKTVTVVTHGGPIRLIFREILGIGEIKIEDCAFAEIEVNGNDIKLINTEGIKVV